MLVSKAVLIFWPNTWQTYENIGSTYLGVNAGAEVPVNVEILCMQDQKETGVYLNKTGIVLMEEDN